MQAASGPSSTPGPSCGAAFDLVFLDPPWDAATEYAATLRLLGGSAIGEDGAAGRINVIATALEARMRVDQFEQLDLAYSPPFATVWDPLLIAAQQLMKEL